MNIADIFVLSTDAKPCSSDYQGASVHAYSLVRSGKQMEAEAFIAQQVMHQVEEVVVTYLEKRAGSDKALIEKIRKELPDHATDMAVQLARWFATYDIMSMDEEERGMARAYTYALEDVHMRHWYSYVDPEGIEPSRRRASSKRKPVRIYNQLLTNRLKEYG